MNNLCNWRGRRISSELREQTLRSTTGLTRKRAVSRPLQCSQTPYFYFCLNAQLKDCAYLVGKFICYQFSVSSLNCNSFGTLTLTWMTLHPLVSIVTRELKCITPSYAKINQEWRKRGENPELYQQTYPWKKGLKMSFGPRGRHNPQKHTQVEKYETGRWNK